MHEARGGKQRGDVEGTIRKVTLSLLGAAAVAASVLLIRQQRVVTPKDDAAVIPPGETVPADLSPEKLRKLGI